MTEPIEQPTADKQQPEAPRRKGLGQLAAALAKAQGLFTNPERNRVVEVKNKEGKKIYEFTYAELGPILEVVRKPLSDNGLAVMQLLTQHDGNTWLRTVLVHTSGEQVACDMLVGAVGMDMQAMGGKVTYLRRYSISALLGIASEPDADDAGRVDHGREPEQQPQRLPSPTKPKGGYGAIAGWRYTRPENFLAWDGANKAYLEVAADKLPLEDLRAAEPLLVKRCEVIGMHADDNIRKGLPNCERDLKLVRHWLTVREATPANGVEAVRAAMTPADDKRPELADRLANDESSPPAEGYATALPGQTGLDPKPAAKTSPWPPVAAHAPHIDVDVDPALVPVTALTLKEHDALTLLEPAECAAMALALPNAPLFAPAMGKEFDRFNDINAEPLTGHWMAKPWLMAHEAAGATKAKARKLLRLAIRDYKLLDRAASGAVPKIETRPKSNLEHEALLDLLGAIMGPDARNALLAKHHQPAAGQKSLI
jgi:hypothetical protein